MLACRVTEPDRWCRRCGCKGAPRDSVTRAWRTNRSVWRPTTLLVTVLRYRCSGCGHVWRQDLSRAAQPRAKLSLGALRLGTGRDRLPAPDRRPRRRGPRGLLEHRQRRRPGRGQAGPDRRPGRFDGVKVIGVDEHVWRHTRKGDHYVTVIIDLTGIRDGTGPARLLDMVEGRSKSAFKTWLTERPKAWRDAVEVVAMDGFTGFKTATTEELPEAVAVMDPFHVVRLCGEALDQCRRRIQQDTPATAAALATRSTPARRMLHTGADLLTDKQKARCTRCSPSDAHVQVEASWHIYQRHDRRLPRPAGPPACRMTSLIDKLSHDVPVD